MTDTLHDPRVRPVRPGDADRIRTLQTHLRRPSPELLEYGIAVGSGFVSVGDAREAHDTGVAEGGAVVGYALPVDAPTRPGCHLAELVVAPDFRREGRGRGLLAAVVDGATGPVTIQTHPENDAALALYEACGFEVVDRRPGAYVDGDALVLCRE